MLKTVFMLILCLSSAGTAFADVLSDANDVYTKSSLKDRVKYIPILAKRQVEMDLANLAANDSKHGSNKQKIMGLLDQANVDSEIKNQTVKFIRDKIDRLEIRDVLSWLDTDLAKKISLVQGNSWAEDNSDERNRFSRQLKTNPPSQQRLSDIEKLANNMKLLDTAVNYLISLTTVSGMAVSRYTGSQDYDVVQARADALKSTRKELESQIKDKVLEGILFTYRTLSDQELNRFSKFSGTKTGKKYAELLAEVTEFSLGKATADFSQKIRDAQKL